MNAEATTNALRESPSRHEGSADRIDTKVWRVAAVVFLGPFMTVLDSTVVNLSLSTIREDLHASIASTQWIVSGYLLALALMLPLNGWLVDRVGAKRLYLACFSAFTLASLLCGEAHTMSELIAFRVLQGVAGGLLAPMTQLMIARVAGKHMARVMGYTGVPVLLAPILGPVVAGAVLKYAHWPWLFYLNLPVGAVAVALAAILLPRDEDSGARRPFDFPGFLLLSPALVCLLYGLEDTSRPEGALTFAFGLVLLVVFARYALRKGSAALLDLGLFRNPVFTAGATTQFLSNGLAYSGQLLIPLYLIKGCELSTAKAGGMIAVMGIGMICTFPSMGMLTDRFGCRAVSAGGAILSLLGTLPFLWMIETRFSPSLAIAGLLVRGLGRGAVGVPSVSAAYAAVAKSQLSVATTALNIVQRLGGPVATTLTAAVLALSSGPGAATAPRSFSTAFVLLVGLHVLTLAATSRLPVEVHATPAHA